MANQVAETILQQLGGCKFIVMTGAKDFVGSDSTLSFRIGRNSTSGNGVMIALTPSDTYTIELVRVAKVKGTMTRTILRRLQNVYNDQLQEVFTELTGLYTRL
jgi:hypothetical protein